MNVTILLYDDFTALDAVGPYEVLRLLPCARVQFVAKTAGIQRSDARSLGLIAERDLASVTATDVLVVPGGPASWWPSETQRPRARLRGSTPRGAGDSAWH
jgi:putative intracellular protease/amidase